MCPECLLAGRSLANSSKPARVLAQMRNAIRNSPLQSVLLAVALVFVAMLWLASDGKKVGNTTSRPNAAAEGGVPPLATPPIAPEINHVPPDSEREHAKDIPPATTGLSAKEVFKRVALAVVSIETQSANGEPLGSGTGFFVDDRGTFITNAHVIAGDGASQVVVKTKNGEERVLTSVADIDVKRDLAALEFTGPVPAHLRLQPIEPSIGERAFAIGNSLGILDRSLSEGLVSGIRFLDFVKHIQTTAPISPGNSGGPLVDSGALVIGVVVFTSRSELKGQNLNFAISAEDLRHFMTRGGKSVKIKDVPSMASTVPSEEQGNILGDGVPQDYVEAVKWYRKAADQGDANAQTSLGYAYHEGKGVPKDYFESVKWYRKAADQGDAIAQTFLGYAYHQGEGVPKDYFDAVKWYRKAADQGDAYAQRELGNAYHQGEGVPKDKVQAYMYFNLASATDSVAAEARETLAKQMTGDQIAKAQRLTREWKPTVQPK